MNGTYTGGVAPGWTAWTGDGGGGPTTTEGSGALPADDTGGGNQFQQITGAGSGNRGGVYREFTGLSSGTYVVTVWVKVPSMGTGNNSWFELHTQGFAASFSGNMNADGNGFMKFDSAGGGTPNNNSTGSGAGGWAKFKSPNINLPTGGGVRFWTKHGGAGATQQYAIDYVSLLQLDSNSITDTMNNGGAYTGGIAPNWTLWVGNGCTGIVGARSGNGPPLDDPGLDIQNVSRNGDCAAGNVGGTYRDYTINTPGDYVSAPRR
jgi:hypothetical protein